MSLPPASSRPVLRLLAICAAHFAIAGPVAAALESRLGSALRPIALGPGLLAHLDRSRREAFLKRWSQAARPG